MIRRLATLSLVATSFLAAQARADFGIADTLNVDVISPPTSVASGALQGPRPVIFQEVANGQINSDIYLNHGAQAVIAAPAVVNGFAAHPSLTPSVILAGTAFNSYLFHFDPSSTPYYVSIIEFEQDIIGVQLFGDGLRPTNVDSDHTLEAGECALKNLLPANTTYPTDVPGRGVEEDIFILAAQGKRLLLAGTGFDQIRVFTKGTAVGIPTAVPELSTMLGWLGLSGIALVTYRRHRKHMR